MNFDPDARQKQLRKDMQALLAGEAEVLRSIDPSQLRDLHGGYHDLLRKLNGIGYLEIGLGIEKDGGQTPFAEQVTAVVAGEALAETFPDLYLGIEISIRLVGVLLARFGSAGQKKRILEPINRGDILATAALRETTGNFPTGVMETRAEKEGDFYRLSGWKRGILNGPLAGVIAVPARIGEQMGLFLVHPGGEGLEQSEPYRMLGYERIPLCDLTLVDAPVREEDLLGPFEPLPTLSEIRTRENLAITVSSLGLMSRTLFGAKKYAGEKKDGGRAPMSQQEIRYRLAEMFALFQTAQLLVYRAAWMLEAGEREATTVADTAKVFVTEAAEELARGAMQISALDGYRQGNDFEAGYRDARFGPSAGETSEVLRMRIADECLRKFG